MSSFSQFPIFSIRRASGLVRMIVVGVATFAILLVCFSLYQYGQGESISLDPRREPRLPSTPTTLGDVDGIRGEGSIGGMKVGETVIGRAQDIQFTVYPPKGTRAAVEIRVSEYLPKPGSDNEFLLENPVARTRTGAGNDVRVSARRGVLEAHRRGAGGFDPRRGRLTGGVVIEFDRRSESDKSQMSEAERETFNSDDIVRIETDELEFDVEYGLLIIPGALKLSARDAVFDANNLEVRLDDAAGRVESLRVARGGRIELMGSAEPYGLGGPGTSPTQRTTMVEWLRASIQARLHAQGLAEADGQPAVESARTEARLPAFEMQGDVPVFRLSQAKSDNQDSGDAIRYFARFEGDVDAVQETGGTAVARLIADWLEVYRTLEDRPEQEGKKDFEPTPAPIDAPQPPAADRMILTWSGPLRVETVGSNKTPTEEDLRDRVLAGGAPARVSSAQAEVSCARFEFIPETLAAEFFGNPDTPVQVQSHEQGRVEGAYILVKNEADRFEFVVEGPGVVSGDFGGNRPATAAQIALNSPPQNNSIVSFSESLRGWGRIVQRLDIEFTGHISRRESRVLDRAIFDGDVRVQSDQSTLESDLLDLTFGALRGWSKDRQYLRHAKATGNVRWREGTNRLASGTIDIPLGLSADGRSIPEQLIAADNVVAVVDNRELRADDRILVEFERVKVARPEKPGESESVVSGAGVPGGSSPPRTREEAFPARLQAFGRVSVSDPSQPLHLEADELDCRLHGGREVDQAVLKGTPEHPASVSVDELQVFGETVSASLRDHWADVPGPGRMIVQSNTDLDGKRRSEPVPIDITWTESMQYRGRENVAQFTGSVKAIGPSETTFEGNRLRIELVDVEAAETVESAEAGTARINPALWDWGPLQPFVDRISELNQKEEERSATPRLQKDIASVYLVGDAVVKAEQHDAQTGSLRSRALLAGPKMSVNRRSDVSKALVEGVGSLQLESFTMTTAGTESAASAPRRGDLFAAVDDGAPHKTLIEWTGRMWYDFAIGQIRFEENVDLKFLSGAQIERVFKGPDRLSGSIPAGRATFLTSRLLTIELDPGDSDPADEADFGKLESDRIARFHASGNVVLKDESEEAQSWITATDVVYNRKAGIMMISGRPGEQARLVRQERGRLPIQTYFDHAIYHPATGKLDTSNTGVIGH